MLDNIIDSVRGRLPDLKARQAEVRDEAERMPPARDFAGALAAPGMSIIAEFKRASPSKGVINAGMKPAERVAAFEAGGASAVSVLTEPDHFMGGAEDLRAARAAMSLPVLRKDFTLDTAHIWEARAMGADAVLLIVAILDDLLLARLLATAVEAGLTALVEVHSREEAARGVGRRRHSRGRQQPRPSHVQGGSGHGRADLTPAGRGRGARGRERCQGSRGCRPAPGRRLRRPSWWASTCPDRPIPPKLSPGSGEQHDLGQGLWHANRVRSQGGRRGRGRRGGTGARRGNPPLPGSR